MSKLKDRVCQLETGMRILNDASVSVCGKLKADIKYITKVLGNNGIEEHNNNDPRCPHTYCYGELKRVGNKLVCPDCSFVIFSKSITHKQLEFEHTLLKQEVEKLKEEVSELKEDKEELYQICRILPDKMCELEKLVFDLTKAKGKKK